MVQLLKNIFAFTGVSFQDYSKKFESLLSICRILKKPTFSLLQEYPLNGHFVGLYHFRLRYHTSKFASTCVKTRAASE